MKLHWLALLLTLSADASFATPPVEPAGFASLSRKAQAARESGDSESAIRLYREALALKPQWSEGLWFLGTLYYDADRYTEARDTFRRLLSKEPKMATGWGMLGLAEFETKQYEESLAHLERGSELGLAKTEELKDVVNYHRALLLTRVGEYEPAMAIIAIFSVKGKDNPKFVEAMGIASLRKPVLPSELPPTERELVMDVGRAMTDAAQRRRADATAEFDTILRKYPDTPNIHFLYGLILLVSDPDLALVQFEDELKISPRHPQALFSIAEEYEKRTDFKSALPFAEQAVNANPKFANAHAVLGQVLVQGDIDLPRGLKELETAVLLSPSMAQTHFALANAYAKASRKDDAARERAEFLRLRKEQAEPTVGSGAPK